MSEAFPLAPSHVGIRQQAIQDRIAIGQPSRLNMARRRSEDQVTPAAAKS
jgi:hypothetical protein